MTNAFRRIADVTGSVVGSPWAFSANIALTVLWLLLGPVFQFSDTWQLTMNTAASQSDVSHCVPAAEYPEP